MPFSLWPTVAAPSHRRRRRLRELVIWGWIVGFCLAAMVATYVMFVEPPPPLRFVIASGGQDGAYFRYARQYAEELQKEGLSVEVRETAGSVENLPARAGSSGVSVAIVQSGVATPRTLENLYALGSLYHEPLWVFYRGDKRAWASVELAGKTDRCRSGGQRHPRHRHAVACCQRRHESEMPDPPTRVSRTVLVQENVAARGRGPAAGRTWTPPSSSPRSRPNTSRAFSTTHCQTAQLRSA